MSMVVFSSGINGGDKETSIRELPIKFPFVLNKSKRVLKAYFTSELSQLPILTTYVHDLS
jgi:hypothetical protein